MRDWLLFIGGNKRLLNFGFLFNFFSSFGQTFFISLFVPFWIDSLQISSTTFGSVFAVVTVISAIFLSFTGKYIDILPVRTYGLIVFSGLMISIALLSQVYHFTLLILALFLVRWFGQGLMTHTSSTGIAKYFDHHRGKALGITTLGHPIAQFLLPLLVIPLIAIVGWRETLIYLAIAAFILVIPSLWAIKVITNSKDQILKKPINSDEVSINYFKNKQFWIIASNVFVIPFLCTAIFLYQYMIGQSKGWDPSWVAFSFAFFAIFSAAALLVSGYLIDNYSGTFLFPLYLIPAIIAFVLIVSIDSKWIFPIFYGLLGMSSGLGSTVKTALQTEVYGSANLGKIRSYFSTILVLSTAVGPPLVGLLLDTQFSMPLIMGLMGCIILVVFIMSFKVWEIKQYDQLASLINKTAMFWF